MTNTSQKEFALFVTLMFVALLLRSASIGRESLWFDEAISYLTAQLSFGQIASNVIRDPHPPLYYLTLNGWFSLWGSDPITGRWLSVVFGVIMLPIVWWLGKQWFTSQWQRITAVLLLAISPFHILYSHELRMYTLLIALAGLVVVAYCQSLQRGGWWWWVLGVTAVLTVYAHLFGAFVLLAIAIHALLYRDRRPELWRIIGIGMVVILAFLPWLFVLMGEPDIGVGSLRPLSQAGDADTLRDPLKPLLTLAFLLFGQTFTWWHTGLALFLTVGTAVVLLLELRKAWRAGDRTMLLPFLIVGVVLGGPIMVYFVRPFFLPERTMAAALPFLLLLLAWGVTRRQSPLPLLVGLTAVTMLLGVAQYFFGGLVKPPYQDVIGYVVAHAQSGDVIVHTSDGSYLPSLSYTSLPNHVLLQGDPGQRKPTAVYEALGGQIWSVNDALEHGNGRLWLIVALEHSVDWQLEQVDSFTQRYFLLDHQEIGGIGVYLFDVTIGVQDESEIEAHSRTKSLIQFAGLNTDRL